MEDIDEYDEFRMAFLLDGQSSLRLITMAHNCEVHPYDLMKDAVDRMWDLHMGDETVA